MLRVWFEGLSGERLAMGWRAGGTVGHRPRGLEGDVGFDGVHTSKHTDGGAIHPRAGAICQRSRPIASVMAEPAEVGARGDLAVGAGRGGG